MPFKMGMVWAARHQTTTHKKGSRMVRTASIFSQILRLVDRIHFARLAREHQSNRYTKRFTAWDHFVAMVFCQLAQAKSLRETCDGLGSAVGKAVHLGIRNLAKKSTLAYANEHRGAALFRTLFFQLSTQLHRSGMGGRRTFRFPPQPRRHRDHPVPEPVPLGRVHPHQGRGEAAPAARPRRLHAVLSDAKTSEVSVARTLALPKGSIVVIDRGYVDYALWGRWTRDDGVYWVTRLKSNTPYRVLKTHPVPPRQADTILLDQTIQLTSTTAKHTCPYRLRRVVARDPKTGKTVVLLTNHEKLAAHTIGQIYRDRWQIELFFKALKQNLKVKTFLGTSENALAVQLWTALIAMLLVKYLQWRSQRNWSLSNLVALLRWNLFQYKDLYRWLEDPLEAPMGLPDHPQLALPGFQIGQLPTQGAAQ